MNTKNAFVSYRQMVQFVERLVDVVLQAPESIRHHLAAVSWWRIVGIAEQQDAGARLKLRNTMERVYSDAKWTKADAEKNVLAAVAHYATTSVESFMLTHAAAPLHPIIRSGKFAEFDPEEALAYAESVGQQDVRDFLRDAVYKNDRDRDAMNEFAANDSAE